MEFQKRASPIISEAQIMTKAAVIAGERLGLDTAAFAAAIGVSETRAIEIKRLDDLLRKGTAPCDRALLLIRLFRAIKNAGNETAARQWLREHNKILGCQPIDMIEDAERLQALIRHLED